MKLSPTDLCDIYSEAFNRGTTMGRSQVEVRVAESTRALLDENNRLKRELETAESRARTQVMTADQRGSFPAMNAERQRIARGIVQYFETATKRKQKPTAEKLLFGLALGDLV